MVRLVCGFLTSHYLTVLQSFVSVDFILHETEQSDKETTLESLPLEQSFRVFCQEADIARL